MLIIENSQKHHVLSQNVHTGHMFQTSGLQSL